MGPGVTALTRISRGTNSAASVRANDRSAALAAPYVALAAIPLTLAMEVVRTTEPPRFISGANFCTAKSGPLAFRLEALLPLLDLRKQQVNKTEGAPFKIFEGTCGYRRGMTARDWLSANRVSLNVVDPALGVPFYLTLVGSPEQIPFEFQYELDIYWGVGRIHFRTADEFANYAKSVVDYETIATVPTSRRIAVFAPQHDFARATQMFVRMVANPLSSGVAPWGRIGERQKFNVTSCLAEEATKVRLADLLRSGSAVLFSGSHGMSFRTDDNRQPDMQGAIVCQDWAGLGAITDADWFAASDVPADANIHGFIHFFFACFGGGYPQFDTFDRLNDQPRQIAAKPMLSRLPQALLAHPRGGALATLAHVDRAWAYSFISDRGGAQLQGFRDVLGRILRGERIGLATDQFNVRWAVLSTELSEVVQEKQNGKVISNAEISSRWVARDDARNYVIFGDPAVRPRVEDMPVLV
jgi:hypothetical protein